MKLCDSKLIMFEGIPGSGKSTMSKRVYEYLNNHGIRSILYSEGCDNPLDLTWHAYLTEAEFDEIITNNPGQSQLLLGNSIFEDGFILVPYRKLGFAPHENQLMRFLEEHEVCYSNTPIVTKDIFLQVFQKRWRQYAQSDASNEGLTIVESAFFQHQIHDLIRLYTLENAAIIDHLAILIGEVIHLNPVLLYLTQSSVKETLLRVWKERGLEGSDKEIRFWEHRKQIEFEAMSLLPIRTFVIDNSSYDWDQVFEIVISILK